MNKENLKKYIFEKRFRRSIVSGKCGPKYLKIFKEEESNEVWKIRGLINNIKEYQKYRTMPEENMNP